MLGPERGRVGFALSGLFLEETVHVFDVIYCGYRRLCLNTILTSRKERLAV